MSLTEHQKSVVSRLHMQILLLPVKEETAKENIHKIILEEPWIEDWLNGKMDGKSNAKEIL